MRTRIRSYFVFTSLGFRVVAFLVEPLILALVGMAITCLTGIPGYIMVPFFYMIIEIMLDYIMFGGICAKEVSHLEYLKCSTKGERIMHTALAGHLLKVFLVDVALLIFNYVWNQIWNKLPLFDMESILPLVALLFISYTVGVLAMTIGRFFDSLQIYYILGMLAVPVGTLVLFANRLCLPIGITVTGIAAIIISIVNVKIALKHIKESYYDKTVKNGI
ncbi:MAG: hypothetical protein ACI4ES_16425 [Roseburia sp.]